MNVALVCDSLVQPGGADRVLKALLDIFADAVVFTSVYDETNYPELEGTDVRTTFIQKLPFRKFLYRHYVPLSPLGFESLDLSDFDLVISISAGCAKGVITSPATFHLGIILTPPRYQWGGILNCRSSKFRSLFRFFSPFLDHYLRLWDMEASKRPDKLVAISEFIQRRIERIYERESEVVYPGIDKDFYFRESGSSKRMQSTEKEDFYLVVSRLYDYKRIDLAIKACKKLGRRLVIIGKGPDEKYLRDVSKSDQTVFRGFVSDGEVRDHMRRCRGLIFPGLEDFGLVAVEALSCGAGVIAYGAGGVAETVKDAETGVLFNNQNTDDLIEAIQKFEKKDFDYDIIEQRGHYFSEDKFKNSIEKIIKDEFRKRAETDEK